MDGQRTSPYQLFMLGLCVYVLLVLAAQTVFSLAPETVAILDAADLFVCAIFFADFVRSLIVASNRTQYLVRWGWLDLISSIPTVDVLRWGRAARVFRIIRVLRGARAARLLGQFTLERRASSSFWAALLVAILATIFGGIAILHLETAAGVNIKGGSDALWWAFVTVTTVGYGDHYPVTGAGRAVAALLMLVGIGLFGTFTAYVASWFLEPDEKAQDDELRAIHAEIAELRDDLARRREAG